MKVTAWKTFEVECEVDACLDDCIIELLGIADEDGMPRRKMQAVDGATKILQRITPDMLGDRLTPDGIALVRERLAKWIEVMELTANGG